MAIIAYIGVPGSGKSHECVKSVIIPNMLKGRRIVTNVDGINPDAIIDYCLKHYKVPREKLGTVIPVTDEAVQADDFLPFKKEGEEGYSGDGSFCRPGDLVCLDEVWRFWPSDKAMSVQHKSFIAEHRHFSDPDTGLTSDLVLMNQALDTIPRFVKSRIETTFRMTKLTMLGAKSRYRVDVFNGVKLFKSSKTTSYQNKYDKNIFPLYNSYNGGNGNESTVDDRQNIFKQTKLWVMVAGFILMFSVSCYLIYSFFAGTGGNKPVTPVHADNAPVESSTVSGDRKSGAKEIEKEENPVSSTWRISGTLQQDDINYIALVNSNGDIRLVNKNSFHGKGVMLFGFVDGEKVTYFSGTSK